MEKETKRALQNILEILREQQELILALREKNKRSGSGPVDALVDRIQRVSDEVGERESYAVDWARLCDRHYAERS